jgi:hypothetical protein
MRKSKLSDSIDQPTSCSSELYSPSVFSRITRISMSEWRVGTTGLVLQRMTFAYKSRRVLKYIYEIILMMLLITDQRKRLVLTVEEHSENWLYFVMQYYLVKYFIYILINQLFKELTFQSYSITFNSHYSSFKHFITSNSARQWNIFKFNWCSNTSNRLI